MILFSSAETRQRRTHSARRPRRRRPVRRPELEPLEERNLLTLSGTWALVNAPPAATGTMILLPTGNVMAQGGGGDNTSSTWYDLRPDSSGNYSGGTWVQQASMSTKRLYFASNVLNNNEVVVTGGEYTGSNQQTFTNTSETYNLATNKWTTNASFPQSQFGDDPSEVLANGNILAGYLAGPQTYTYNPTTNTWALAATKQNSDQSDEECWVKLPNGDILSYNIFSSISTGTSLAQVYNQTTNTWTDTGTVPVQLSSSADGYEMGPGFMLPNGLTLEIGANGNTALYNYQTNTWSAGPTVPNGKGADDAPGAVLPDGQVLFAADTPLFGTGTELFDYDYNTNTITQVTGLPTALQTNLNATAAYPTRMLVLPNGQLLLSSGNFTSNQLWVFTPSDSAQAAWQPTVTSVKANGSSYTLTGTQLNGIDEGAAYGDDVEMSSNYPIVKVVSSSGAVTYARTSAWSSTGVSAVGDTTPETVTFNLPARVGAGTYTLYTIANGIASKPVSFTVPKGAGAGSADLTGAGGGDGSADLTSPDPGTTSGGVPPAPSEARSPFSGTTSSLLPVNATSFAQGPAAVFLAGLNGPAIPMSQPPATSAALAAPGGYSALTAPQPSTPLSQSPLVLGGGGDVALTANDGPKGSLPTPSDVQALDEVFASGSFSPPL